MHKEDLKQVLLKSTEECLHELGRIKNFSKEFRNELILISKKYYEGKSRINIGVIDYEKWDLIKRQVDLGLINLIDKIESITNGISTLPTEDKKIPITDAIEFFVNSIIGEELNWVEIFETEERGIVETNASKIIDDAECLSNGNYKILISGSRISSALSDEEDFSEIKKSKVEIVGNLRDVNNIQLHRSSDDINQFLIEFKNTNNLKTIHYKYQVSRDRYFNGRRKTEDKVFDGKMDNFTLYASTEDLAQRIKNAADYISIALGRKENTF